MVPASRQRSSASQPVRRRSIAKLPRYINAGDTACSTRYTGRVSADLPTKHVEGCAGAGPSATRFTSVTIIRTTTYDTRPLGRPDVWSRETMLMHNGTPANMWRHYGLYARACIRDSRIRIQINSPAHPSSETNAWRSRPYEGMPRHMPATPCA
jgi:hypothetical protein